jgi:hypothetical protein
MMTTTEYVVEKLLESKVCQRGWNHRFAEVKNLSGLMGALFVGMCAVARSAATFESFWSPSA